MRAQLFENTLKKIVEEIDAHLGDPLSPDTGARQERSADRTLLTKIRRMAAKAVDRSEG